MFRNAKNVGYYMIGKGSLLQLDDMLQKRRLLVKGPAIFFLDHFFQNRDLSARLPVEDSDLVLYVDTTDEPTTHGVDAITEQVKEHLHGKLPCAMLAFGGGSTMDT